MKTNKTKLKKSPLEILAATYRTISKELPRHSDYNVCLFGLIMI